MLQATFVWCALLLGSGANALGSVMARLSAHFVFKGWPSPEFKYATQRSVLTVQPVRKDYGTFESTTRDWEFEPTLRRLTATVECVMARKVGRGIKLSLETIATPRPRRSRLECGLVRLLLRRAQVLNLNGVMCRLNSPMMANHGSTCRLAHCDSWNQRRWTNPRCNAVVAA